MSHVRGAHYHHQTQGKIERSRHTLKNSILLENHYPPSDLEQQIVAFVGHSNQGRYHENLDNLMPADVYFGRGDAILLEREKIKRQTKQNRRLQHRAQAA
jgi:putative transposase